MSGKRMVARREWAAYMNTGDAGAPVWSRIGEGFTDLEQTMNAIEYSRHYVHEQTERKDVVGYAPQVAYSCDVFTGDPVIDRVGEITDQELVGTQAQVEIVQVNLYQPIEGGCRAFRRTWSVMPDTKGAGVEALVLTGVFAAVSDAEAGAFSEEGGFVAG